MIRDSEGINNCSSTSRDVCNRLMIFSSDDEDDDDVITQVDRRVFEGSLEREVRSSSCDDILQHQRSSGDLSQTNEHTITSTS